MVVFKWSENQSLNMNNNIMLQNYIESGSNFNFGQPKGRKSSKIGSQELQLQIGTVFNEICQLLEDNNVSLNFPEETIKSTDKINSFKYLIQQLIQQTTSSKAEVDSSNMITCVDCQNYEASLQKLENEVRQHIRLEQQLKIFQDTQEQKIEEYKKERKEQEKKIENLRKQLQDSKNLSNTISEKVQKLQAQNEHYKKENRELRKNVNVQQEPLHTKRDSHKHSAYAYESKQNKIDWVHRNVSVKKEQKEKNYERKSIQKRSDSAQKNWRLSGNQRSHKMMSVMNDKLVHEKTKEERRKVIQSKFDYRR